MARYLKVVDARYNLNEFVDMADETTASSIREAATCYAFHLQSSKILVGGFSKIILNGGVSKEGEEVKLDVLEWCHPYTIINRRDRPRSVIESQSSYVREITNALLRISERYPSDVKSINALHDAVRDLHYKFEGVWAKDKPNSTKSHSVGVRWRTDSKIRIGFVIRERNSSEEVWVDIISIPIGLGLFETLLGKFEWSGNSKVKLWNTNKRDYWELYLSDMSINFYYEPAEQGNSHGQYALAIMYLEGNYMVEKDKEKAMGWLKKSAASGYTRAKKLLEEMRPAP